MAISRQIQAAISKGDYAAIEDEWLSKSSENPEDLDYFVGVARALGGQDQRDRARFLLEVLDEELKERKLWSRRLKLLERAGELQHAPDTLHKAIVQTLTALHGKHSGFAMLSEKVGLHRAPTQIAKIWEKVERLRNLMSFTGCALGDALATITTTPARLLGLTQGVLEAGRPADLTLLDEEHRVVATLVGGRIVHDSEGA